MNDYAGENQVLLKKIAVIGAGSWGTALAKLFGDQGKNISLWGHKKEHVEAIDRERENKTYLPGYKLGKNIKVTSDIREAVSGHKIIVMVVPSHVFRETLLRVFPFMEEDATIVSAAKGIENNTLMTMTGVITDVLHKQEGHEGLRKVIDERACVLAGPSFAVEVAGETPTAVTVGSINKDRAQFIQKVFSSEKFRVYASIDVIGLELGGALKNIIAIAAGICDGLGYGTNARAALITRGLAEITRLGVKMGANPLTFSGLAGLGDLVLTCTGDLSRNRSVGIKLGQGETLSEILDEMEMVAEGVKTARSAMALAMKMEVEMPILEQIYKVIYEDKSCKDAVHALLTRDLKEELEYW